MTETQSASLRVREIEEGHVQLEKYWHVPKKIPLAKGLKGAKGAPPAYEMREMHYVAGIVKGPRAKEMAAALYGYLTGVPTPYEVEEGGTLVAYKHTSNGSIALVDESTQTVAQVMAKGFNWFSVRGFTLYACGLFRVDKGTLHGAQFERYAKIATGQRTQALPPALPQYAPPPKASDKTWGAAVAQRAKEIIEAKERERLSQGAETEAERREREAKIAALLEGKEDLLKEAKLPEAFNEMFNNQEENEDV